MEKEILRIISLLKPEDINDLTLAGGKNKSFSEKIKQNQQDISKGQRKQFNLGNGQLFQDPVKAAEYLLEREYGNSFLFKSDNHDTIFIPPVFISQEYSKKTSVSVLDYKVKNDIKKSLESLQEELPKYCKTKELEELLEILNENENNWKSAYDKWVRQMKPIYDGNEILKSDSRFKWLMESKPTDVSGEEIEHWFFDHLSSEEMKNHLKDCVILTSPTVKLSFEKKKNFHREFDFLIISWQRKLIIGIEAKRRTTKDTLTTASEQLNKCQKFFEEGFGNTLGPEEWTFFPVIFVGQCDFISNSKHFITMQSDIKHWLENVYLDYVCSSLLHIKENLKKILQIMVFTIHISRKDLKAPITTSSWVQYVTDAIFSVSTIDNIIFYSNNQLPILISDDPRYRKLFIRGGYGTGKSFLLQEKAKILAKQSEYNGRIIYFTDCDKRNLFLESLKYYLEPLGILVKSTNDGSLWESPSNPEVYILNIILFFL